MARVIIGTRGSALARWQSAHVSRALREAHGGLEVEERIIKTEGDAPPPGAMVAATLGQTGVFVRRIEEALLSGEVDLAVHSLKDMPTDQPDGLTIAAVTERHDPRDALVTGEGWTLEQLPPGTVLGTGSPRRRCQLLHRRPDLQVVPVRGNVDTRVGKVEKGELGGVVLALAGLERLGLDRLPVRPIDVADCLPAVAQGALGLECRSDDERIVRLAKTLEHPRSSACVDAERSFLRRLGGGCLAPATAYARFVEDRLLVEALVGSPGGEILLVESETGDPSDAGAIGSRLAARLLSAGAGRILDAVRQQAAGIDDAV